MIYRNTKPTSVSDAWQKGLVEIEKNGAVCAPRGKKIKEVLGNSLTFDMRDPIIRVASRKLNYKFMFGEAWWICSGSNRLSDIAQYLPKYADYTDDGEYLNGAYGPPFVEQVSYVVDALVKDPNSRQAVLTIWRPRPGPSKDIPCTTSQQFFIRGNKLHMVVYMRSQDMVWGVCYDCFSFSSMAKVVQTMLRGKGYDVTLGQCVIQYGSAHIYEPFWDKIPGWSLDPNRTEDPVWNDPLFTSVDEYLTYLKTRAAGAEFQENERPGFVAKNDTYED